MAGEVRWRYGSYKNNEQYAIQKSEYSEEENYMWIARDTSREPWYIKDYRRELVEGAPEVIAGPFDDLNAAKAAYIVIYGRT